MFRNILWTAEKYGRVHVKYGKPISLKERISEFAREQQIEERVLLQDQGRWKREFQKYLSMDLVYSLSENLVIMSTSMVASMILLRRQGGIKEEDLLKNVTWLYNEILARNGSMSINIQPSQATIRNSLKYLGSFIDMRKDVFTPYVKANMDYKNILMLSYYRNNLIHLFLNESYLAVSLHAFGDQSQGIPVQRLWDQTDFITNILNREFMVRHQIRDFDSFGTVLTFMEKRGFLAHQVSGTITISKEGQFAI